MSFLQGSFQSIASVQTIFTFFFAIYSHTVQVESGSHQPLSPYLTLIYKLKLCIGQQQFKKPVPDLRGRYVFHS